MYFQSTFDIKSHVSIKSQQLFSAPILSKAICPISLYGLFMKSTILYIHLLGPPQDKHLHIKSFCSLCEDLTFWWILKLHHKIAVTFIFWASHKVLPFLDTFILCHWMSLGTLSARGECGEGPHPQGNKIH